MSDIDDSMIDACTEYCHDYCESLKDKISELIEEYKREEDNMTLEYYPEDICDETEYVDRVFDNHSDGELVDEYNIDLNSSCVRDDVCDAIRDHFMRELEKEIRGINMDSIGEVRVTCDYLTDTWEIDTKELLELAMNHLRMRVLQ